ncbi:MAG: alpha/beta hydrolase [bacterium]
MLIFLVIVLVLIMGFLFFSKPRMELPNPTADIETKMGRTTIYHYRSKIQKSKGGIALVHGFCEHHLYFQKVAEPLTKAGYDCIAINLFGYCGSLPNEPDSYTVEAYARQIQEALQELERLRLIKKLVAVWGHSMGGAAVYLASSKIVFGHPEVQGIFFENPGFGSNFSLLSILIKPFASLANFAGPRHLLQPFVNLLFTHVIKDPEAKCFMKHMLTDYAPKKQVATANLNSISKLGFSLENLSENAFKKMYFIFSKKDKLISFKKVEKSIIKNVRGNSNFKEERMLILPSTDHFISLQAPQEIAGYVLKQLKDKEALVASEVAL